MFILTLFVYFILAYLTVSVAYYALFCVANAFFKPEKRDQQSLEANTKASFAIFVPAYKEDGVIVDTAKNVLKQNYPDDLYKIVILADQLQKETLSALRQLPIQVIEVQFEKSTKAKSLNFAFEHMESDYDLAVILDADNHIESDFLLKCNKAYVDGHLVIQAHRTAKNQENDMAQLDAISEELNNSMFRKGHQVLGLPAALIGSGMVLDYQIYREHMQTVHAIGGFDKELEMSLLRDRRLSGNKFYYLEDTLVFDEKVSDVQVFGKQRTRWISAQIKYALKGWKSAIYELFAKGNIAYFDKVLQFWLPPRLLLLGGMGLLTLLSPLLGRQYFIYLSSLLLFLLVCLTIALPRRFRTYKTLYAFRKIPLTFFSMIKATLNFRKGFKSFIPTPHQHSSKN